jgi:hypothetical protein
VHLDVAHRYAGWALCVQHRLAATAFEREIDEVAELVHGRTEVVEHLELFAEFGEGAHHRGNHQLARDELAERELPFDDEPAADAEKSGARQGLQREGRNDLPEQDGEVLAAVVEIVLEQPVRATLRELGAAGRLEGDQVRSHLLEPAFEYVLCLRLLDGRRDKPS